MPAGGENPTLSTDSRKKIFVFLIAQVKGAAQGAFNVWVDGGELQWAKEVWDRTVAAGFANYSNEIERHRAAVLFFGLAGLYRDFCSLAWEERDAIPQPELQRQARLDRLEP
jgi:hypothetical protein